MTRCMGRDKEQNSAQRYPVSERLETVGFRAFLGLKIHCADCTKMRGKFGKDDVLKLFVEKCYTIEGCIR